MRKVILIGVLILATFILSACDGVDLSQLSDEDLGRIADQAIVCNSPYMRHGTGCCLDQDNSSICDQDEGTQGELSDEFSAQDLYNNFYDKYYDDLENLDIDSEIAKKAKKMIKEAEHKLAESFKVILDSKKKGKDVFDAKQFYFDGKKLFYQALELYDIGDFEESAFVAVSVIDLANRARDIVKSGYREWEHEKKEERHEASAEELEEKIKAAEDFFEELDELIDETEDIEYSEKITNHMEEAGNWIELAWGALEEGNLGIIPGKLENANRHMKDAKRLLSEDNEFDDDDDEHELDDIELEAEMSDNGVVLEWSEYEGDGFEGYKIVRSYDVEDPKYPEDGYIEFITDVEEDRYVDSDTLEEDAYYAITVLTKYGNVYSNSEKIELEDDEPEEEEEDDSEDFLALILAEEEYFDELLASAEGLEFDQAMYEATNAALELAKEDPSELTLGLLYTAVDAFEAHLDSLEVPEVETSQNETNTNSTA